MPEAHINGLLRVQKEPTAAEALTDIPKSQMIGSATLPSFVTDNPALITGLVRAFLGLALAFWPNLFSASQQEALLLVVAAGLALTAVSHKTTVPKVPSDDATSASIQKWPLEPPGL